MALCYISVREKFPCLNRMKNTELTMPLRLKRLLHSSSRVFRSTMVAVCHPMSFADILLLRTNMIANSWRITLVMVMLVGCSASNGATQPTVKGPSTATSIPVSTIPVIERQASEPSVAEETPGPYLDFAEIRLVPADLPLGFNVLQDEFMGVTLDEVSNSHLGLETSFILWRTTPFELVFGLSQRLNRSEQSIFDSGVDHAEALLDGFLVALGAQSVGELEPSQPPADVGDSVSGFYINAILEGMGAVRVEIVIFRRDGVGIYLFVMYLAEEQPVVTASELAEKMDRRILDVISGSEP